jgi:signal transduction histidine kinase
MLILLLLLSLFITLGLGFYVLMIAPHLAINRAFAVFVGLMLLWIVKDLALWGFHGPDDVANWWAQISFLVGVILQFSLLLFSDVFPENNPPRWRRAFLLSIPLLVFLPLLFSGALWDEAGFRRGNFSISLKPAAYAFGLYTFTIEGIGLAQLVGKYRRYRHQLWGQQIASTLVALIFTSIFLILSTNLLPALGVYVFMPASSIFIVIGALIYAYAISNFKLFSIQTALDQLRLFPIANKVAIAVIGTGVAGFIVCQIPIAIWSFGLDVPGWKKFIVFSAISGLIPSLALILWITKILSRPLREFTTTALDVASGNYGAQTNLQSNDELGVLAASFNAMSHKMAEDIARLREINQAMIRSEKLATAGTLAAGVAHEVSNPLASISSLVQSLLARASDERERETLRIILTQITRISGVLRDLMDFARPKPSTLSLVDINEAILKSLELARFDKRFKILRVRTDLAPAARPVALDADRIQQVLLNLLLNARDAIEEGGGRGEIAIATIADEKEVRIKISDTGVGIPAEHIDRIFDPFFTTKVKQQGTGLGLAVCHSIIAAHGGNISVQSDDRSTTFSIVLPLAASSRAEELAAIH